MSYASDGLGGGRNTGLGGDGYCCPYKGEELVSDGKVNVRIWYESYNMSLHQDGGAELVQQV